MKINTNNYYQEHEFTAILHGREIRFVSKPGIPYWDTVTPAASLLADNIDLASNARVLVIGCGHGALGAALAQEIPDGRIVMTDANSIAVSMAKKTLRLNDIYNTRVHTGISVLPASNGTFDTVILLIPKGRDLIRHWLMESFTALKAGGQLYITGANQEGIKSAVSDMEAVFGNSTTLAYKKGGRVSVATKESNTPGNAEWTALPGIAPGTWYQFDVTVREESFTIKSLPGIFSYDKPDEGTELLLENLEIKPSARVLDIGCGYGIIGMFASRKGSSHVDLIDIDQLSLASTRENINLNGIIDAEVLKSDLLSSVRTRRYGLIVSNPPFHIGPSELNLADTLISDTHSMLGSRGRLVLVANRFLRYDRTMQNVFGNVNILAETTKYHVLQSVKY